MNKRILLAFALTISFLFIGSMAFAAEWAVPGDFATIQAAIDSPSVQAGDKIMVGPGEHAGALITQAVEIKGEGGATISSGPAHPSGLIQGFRILAGGGGCSINHLRFTVDLAVMNGAAQNDVTVSHCTFLNTIQAISNWRGSRWEISHNEIIDLRTRCGGGIGILVADYAATADGVLDNVVSHNKITGTLHVAEDDCGGYNGSGIVFYADFRWGASGAQLIAYNRAVKNKISMTSDTPAVVDIVAVELTDTRNDDSIIPPVIKENAIGFNDWRDTEFTIDFTPDILDQHNDISRNLGENRGHGLHPKAFGPGGN